MEQCPQNPAVAVHQVSPDAFPELSTLAKHSFQATNVLFQSNNLFVFQDKQCLEDIGLLLAKIKWLQNSVSLEVSI